MSWSEKYDALRDYFEANWAQTDIAWENQSFVPDNTKPFVAFEIVTVDDDQTSFGDAIGNNFRTLGNIYLHLHCPHGWSQSEIEGFTSDLAKLFRSKTFSFGVVCRAPRQTPAETIGPFRRISVVVPFYFDEIDDPSAPAEDYTPPADPSTVGHFYKAVDNIAELKNLDYSYKTALVRGYNTPGDQGGGFFFADDADTTADDAGLTIKSNGPAIVGRWKRQLIHGKITPEMFGAPLDYSAIGEDTNFVLKAMQAAMTEGMAVLLRRMYRCGELQITTDPNYKGGLTMGGWSGEEFKRQHNNSTGLELLDTGQRSILRGGNITGSAFYNWKLHDMLFSGADKRATQALLSMPNVSQGSLINVSFRRVRGSFVFMNKGEDLNYLNCRFGLGGNSDGIPAVCFGDAAGSPPDPLDRIGSNAIRFNECRFEFIDGPHMGIQPGLTNAWASSVFVDHCKMEAGDVTTSDSNETYGLNRASYPIVDFRTSLENRCTVKFTDMLMSRGDTSNNTMIFGVGACDDFVVTNPQISGSDNGTFNLFQIEDQNGNPVRAKNFIFRGANIRTYSEDNQERATITFSNKNIFPIKYEHPIGGKHMGNSEIINQNFLNMIYGGASCVMETSDSAKIKCVTDPDPSTDPCLSPTRSVIAASGANSDRLMVLAPKLYLPTEIGLARKVGRRVRLFLRVKKTGDASTASLRIRVGTGTTIATVSIPETVWTWKYVDLDLPNVGDDELRIVNSSANNANHTVYLDAIQLEYIDFIETSFTYDPPSLTNGSSTSTTFTATGAEIGDKVDIFPPTAYSGGMAGIAFSADITAANTGKLYLTNNSGVTVDLASGSWMARVTKRNGIR